MGLAGVSRDLSFIFFFSFGEICGDYKEKLNLWNWLEAREYIVLFGFLNVLLARAMILNINNSH